MGVEVQLGASLRQEDGLGLSVAVRWACTDALGLEVLIGVGFSLVGLLIVVRFMPARGTVVSEDDDSSLPELELEGPLAPIFETSSAEDDD